MEKERLYQQIKALHLKRPMTNMYDLSVIDHATNIWTEDEGVLFSYVDHGINRLSFCVCEKNVLDSLINRIQAGTYYLEYLSKDRDDTISGLTLVTRMKRLANPDCRTVFEDHSLSQYRDDTIGETAKPQDVSEINKILWSIFRTEISHLLCNEELADRIKNGQIMIHRDKIIDAVLMLDIMPKKFYINQIVNCGEKRNIHAMLQNRLWRYAQNGGKYMYAWVEEDNIASMKFHGKYGMRHDGMWSMIWRLER